MKYFSLLALFISSINICIGQFKYDSLQSLPDFKHRPLVSALEGLATNVIVNRVNANLRGLEWAKVTPQDWYNNLHTGFQSDGDAFGTNFFGHPYHGSLYFNAARSQGSSFWGAIPYVMVGSWTWEYFGENESPSEIDWNTTTLGGIYIGEITFRLTSRLLRGNKFRKFKFLRNSLATAINPMVQFNSLIYSDVKSKIRGTNYKEFPVVSQLSGGIAHLLYPQRKFISRNYFHLNYSLVYGDFFDNSKKYKPFDYFVLRTWLDVSTFGSLQQNYLSMTSHAPLWRLYHNAIHTFSISNHYDFMHNPIFKIGAISISADYHFTPHIDNGRFITSLKAGPIIFGSSKSEVIEKYGEELGNEINYRDYVYGKGLMFELELFLRLNKWGRVMSSLNYWGIFIQRDTPGVEQNATFKLEYYFPLFKNAGIGVEYFGYKRVAKYDDFEEFSLIQNNYSEIKLLSYVTF